MRVSQLPLNELYARPKITASVEAAIRAKEDFSKRADSYCEKVCKLKCKQKTVSLLNTPVDILIVQDHMAPNGKFDRRDGQQEQTMQNIITYIAKQAGLTNLTFRITSLLKCKPTEQDFPRGKAPTTTVLRKCTPYLLAEIAACKPKVIISLSTAVTKALGLAKHSNTGNRGDIVQSEYGPVVVTIHPRALTMIRQNASGAFWGADFFNVIRRDFIKAARVAKGELSPMNLMDSIERVKANIRIARSIDDVRDILRTIDALPEAALVSFDTETTGLDGMADGAKVLCIQFGWRDPATKQIVAAVIPLWHRENTMYEAQDAWDLVVPLLVGPRGKIAHNGKFDILYIYHTTGVRVRNLKFDTMLVLHSIDSGVQGCYGLKTAVTDYLPETGLSGYEGLLPKLTKITDDEVVEEEESEDE
jgi:uracil-DNA glycosylase family 4